MADKNCGWMLSVLVASLALLSDWTSAYEPYSLGKISYYESEPRYKSYHKRLSDEPYRAIQQAFLPPPREFDTEPDPSYYRLQQEIIDEISPLVQRSSSPSASMYDFGDNYRYVNPAGATAEDPPVSDSDAAAFFEYLAANDNQWPPVANPGPESLGQMDYDYDAAPAVVKKSPSFAKAPTTNIYTTIKATAAAFTASSKVTTTEVPTTTQKLSTTSSSATEATTIADSSMTEDSTIADKDIESNPKISVQPSIIEAVKRFLVQRHNQEIGQKRKRFFSRPEDLLKEKSNLMNKQP